VVVTGTAAITGSLFQIGLANSNYFNGTIDDVRIYNRALSAQEVAQLYKLGGANVAHSNTVTLQSGLVGYWTFDGKQTNSTTNTETDSSDMGNTGTLVNLSTTTSPTAGKIGQALKFVNGVSNRVEVPDAGSLKPTQISVAAWVYPTSLPDRATVAGKWTNDSWNDGYGLSHYTAANGTNNINFWVNNYSTNYASTTLSLNKWTHLVGTYDGASIILYANGVRVNSMAYSTAITHSTHNLFIGEGIGASPYSWAGKVDDVRVYNRALSAQEVAQLYATGR
jgi:hypothetical protein